MSCTAVGATAHGGRSPQGADCGGGWRCVCPGPKPSPGPGAPAGRRVRVWAEPGSCNCGKPGDACTCQMHRRAWQDSQLLADGQWEAGGTCQKAGGGGQETRDRGLQRQCHTSTFEALSRVPGYSPKKACDRANALCNSSFPCGGCGPGRQPQYTPTCNPFGAGGFLDTANRIHDECGPYGADKLAHCWAFCLATKCSMLGGPAAWWLVEIVEGLYNRLGETRPDHQQANAAGVSCGRQGPLSGCFDCCVAATYDILIDVPR